MSSLAEFPTDAHYNRTGRELILIVDLIHRSCDALTRRRFRFDGVVVVVAWESFKARPDRRTTASQFTLGIVDRSLPGIRETTTAPTSVHMHPRGRVWKPHVNKQLIRRETDHPSSPSVWLQFRLDCSRIGEVGVQCGFEHRCGTTRSR